jgi:hypothetical protein
MPVFLTYVVLLYYDRARATPPFEAVAQTSGSGFATLWHSQQAVVQLDV